MECRVYNVEREVWNVECRVYSVDCQAWILESGVQRVKCQIHKHSWCGVVCWCVGVVCMCDQCHYKSV